MADSRWKPLAIDASLSYWLAPHFGWKPSNDTPDGWPEQVGCVAVDVPGAPLVLVDPIAPNGERDPAGAAAFWAWLAGRHAARGGIAILLSNHYHGRHAPEIVAKYPGTRVYAAAITNGKASVGVTDVVGDGDVVPAGIVTRAIDGLDEGELAWHIPGSRALFFADAVLGTPDGVRLAPPKWARDASLYDSVFVPSVRRLLALEAEHVIPSHGPFVPGGGVRQLAAALG